MATFSSSGNTFQKTAREVVRKCAPAKRVGKTTAVIVSVRPSVCLSVYPGAERVLVPPSKPTGKRGRTPASGGTRVRHVHTDTRAPGARARTHVQRRARPTHARAHTHTQRETQGARESQSRTRVPGICPTNVGGLCVCVCVRASVCVSAQPSRVTQVPYSTSR